MFEFPTGSPSHFSTHISLLLVLSKLKYVSWCGNNLGRGSTFRERIERNGYTNWSRIGENITAGMTRDEAQEAIDAWLASDLHCANLMNPNYKEVGLAHYEKTGSTYTHYWTQNFGTK